MQSPIIIYDNANNELSDSDYWNPCCDNWIGREHRECGGHICLTDEANWQAEEQEADVHKREVRQRFDAAMAASNENKNEVYRNFMHTLSREDKLVVHDYEDEKDQ